MYHKTSPTILQEISGDRFASLADAQRAALAPIAADLAATLRARLAAGQLVHQGGRIMPRRKEEIC